MSEQSNASALTLANNRNFAIDALRVFLALGVLHAHTVAHYGREAVVAHWRVINFFAIFRVPAFYFIAGFILACQIARMGVSLSKSRHCEKISAKDSVNSLCRNTNGHKTILIRKLRQLVVPAVFFTLFPFISRGYDLLLGLKTDFYFLPTLFFMILLYCGIDFAVKKFTSARRGIFCILLGIYAIATTAFFYTSEPKDLAGALHYDAFLEGNIFFIAGTVSGIYRDKIIPVVKNIIFVIASCVIYMGCYALFVDDPLALPKDKIFELNTLTSMVGVIAIFSFFIGFMNILTRSAFVRRISLYLSQRSLPMYVLQNVIIMIVFTCIDISYLENPGWHAVFTFLAVLIGVLLTHDLLTLIPGVSRYVFGRDKKILPFCDIFRKEPRQ